MGNPLGYIHFAGEPLDWQVLLEVDRLMERWETPRIAVEQFVANEYCSISCLSLACHASTDANGKKHENTSYLPSDYSASDLWGDTFSQLYGKTPGKDNVISYSGKTYELGSNNHVGDCSDPDKNYLRVDGNNNLTLIENNKNLGSLDGIFTRQVDLDNNGYDDGDLFAWVTFGGPRNGESNSRLWLHWAFASVASALHPNRS